MKSGNSTTSSSSVRSALSPKVVTSGVARSVPSGAAKPRNPTSAVKMEKSPQSSFEEDEEVVVPEGLVNCSYCKRNFAEDRIEKHQVICKTIKTKKRRVYDGAKKRVQVRNHRDPREKLF